MTLDKLQSTGLILNYSDGVKLVPVHDLNGQQSGRFSITHVVDIVYLRDGVKAYRHFEGRDKKEAVWMVGEFVNPSEK